MTNTDNKTNNEYIKSFYNNVISKVFKNTYEFNRWFKSKRLMLDYVMMYKAISHHLLGIKFNSVLELGPGPGTWTRILFRQNPYASFTLVDISHEMKAQFMLEMRQVENVDYIVSDINEFSTSKKFELLFSSRAIEYIENPEKLCEKIYDLVTDNGSAMILTKNPLHYRLRKKSSRKEHSGQLNHTELANLMKIKGFSDIKIFPVIIRVPLLDRLTTRLSEKLFNDSYRKPVDDNLSKFAESYIIIAKK